MSQRLGEYVLLKRCKKHPVLVTAVRTIQLQLGVVRDQGRRHEVLIGGGGDS